MHANLACTSVCMYSSCMHTYGDFCHQIRRHQINQAKSCFVFPVKYSHIFTYCQVSTPISMIINGSYARSAAIFIDDHQSGSLTHQQPVERTERGFNLQHACLMLQEASWEIYSYMIMCLCIDQHPTSSDKATSKHRRSRTSLEANTSKHGWMHL
jgi:hypothetical protein